ncbi:MAG: hypothetical protein V1767_03480 [Chloroflexota bacterium]
MKKIREVGHCAICGCELSSEKNAYAKDHRSGRSHVSTHHYIPERLFGRSKTLKNKSLGMVIFETSPWKGMEGKSDQFCYECGEILLHNPVLLRQDIKLFARLVRLRHLNEVQKTDSKQKIRKRIILLHEVIKEGLKVLLAKADK